MESQNEKYRIGADYFTKEQYEAFVECTLHPTYEELGHCYFGRDTATCHIEEEIGDFDARCKGCIRREQYQTKLF